MRVGPAVPLPLRCRVAAGDGLAVRQPTDGADGRANALRLERASLDQRQRTFSGTSVKTCVPPDGHSTVSLSTRWLAPRPKSSSFECCERKPDPACTIFVRRKLSVSTITRAPIASRLLAVPARRIARDAPLPGEVVAEHAKLRRLPRRHHREIRIAVPIEIEHGERSAVLIEIESDRCPTRRRSRPWPSLRRNTFR